MSGNSLFYLYVFTYAAYTAGATPLVPEHDSAKSTRPDIVRYIPHIIVMPNQPSTGFMRIIAVRMRFRMPLVSIQPAPEQSIF